MPMTRDERIELLKLARQAKAEKKLKSDEVKKEPVKRGKKKKDTNPEKEPEPEPEPEQVVEEKTVVEDQVVEEKPVVEEPVKKVKSKKQKEPVNTLTLELPTDQPDVIYETEVIKRPKKKIIKKIIYEDNSDDSVEEVIVDNRKKKNVKEVKKIIKPVKLNESTEPEPEPVKKECAFNFFNC